jgi:6-phosphofructo-2-kinase / fructose-2,6-biphosphatase 4
VGIYDAVNPTSAHRRAWKNLLDEHDIQTLFVESMCDNQEIIEQNVRSVKISSPDVCPYLTKVDSSMLDGTRMMQSKITLLELMLKFQITNLSMKMI